MATVSQQKKYLAAQKAFVAMTNLKVGDKVRVLRKAEDYQFGWDCPWDDDMSEYLEENCSDSFEVTDIKTTEAWGIELDDNWFFPFYVLQVVDESLIKLSDDYNAKVNSDGSIDVGCQHISYDALKRVYDAATKSKNTK